MRGPGPDTVRRCQECRRALPKDCHGGQKYCTPCGDERARYNDRRRLARLAELRRNGEVIRGSGLMGESIRRARCDRSLNRGRCARRCPQCARLYVPQGLEDPCPSCGDHLDDTPPRARFA